MSKIGDNKNIFSLQDTELLRVTVYKQKVGNMYRHI